MTSDNKQRILDLYGQIDRLYEEIRLLEASEGWAGSLRGEGNEFLIKAFSDIQHGKWKSAVQIFKSSYGLDFFVPGTNGYKKLSQDMYEQLLIPKAPDRNDHSINANLLRQKRNNIRSQVHTYISRMKKYASAADNDE